MAARVAVVWCAILVAAAHGCSSSGDGGGTADVAADVSADVAGDVSADVEPDMPSRDPATGDRPTPPDVAGEAAEAGEDAATDASGDATDAPEPPEPPEPPDAPDATDAGEDAPAGDAAEPDAAEPDAADAPDACVPACDGKACGANGCGGQCGSCDDGLGCTTDTCDAGECRNVPTSSPYCCEGPAQCDDGDPCTLDKCGDDLLCAYADIQGCCEADDACDLGACTTDTCAEGWCVHVATLGPGCCAGDVAAWRFDAGDDGWAFDNSQAAVGWRVASDRQAMSPPGALWYGNPATGDFDAGGVPHFGFAFGPEVQLPGGVGVLLTANVFMDTESSWNYDVLTIHVEAAGEDPVMVWQKPHYVVKEAFFPVIVRLDAFAGRKARIVLAFDTVDGTGNSGAGVFVDDVVVTSACEPTACGTDADCDDSVVMTEERCVAGACAFRVPAEAPAAGPWEW